jgi:tRNA threonylcarbamoyladenosine biosynthesis protein TsaE
VETVTGRFSARFLSRSARATHALGRRLGGLLRPGDVVALVGDLGAGKTQLVRGVCAGARVPLEEVSSPSFAIVATYRGRIPVHHADLYRIGDEDELYGTGFGDLVGGDGALLVEWADRIPAALPEEKLTLTLAHHPRDPDVRRVEVEGVGERHAALARRLARAPRRPSTSRRRGRRSAQGERLSGTRATSRSTSTSRPKPKPKPKPKSSSRSRSKTSAGSR